MRTYPEMNGKIKEILRLSDNPAALYAAARIEELERELREAQLKNTELCFDFHTEMREDKLTIHIQQKALDECTQTVRSLLKELETECKLRREAEDELSAFLRLKRGGRER